MGILAIHSLSSSSCKAELNQLTLYCYDNMADLSMALQQVCKQFEVTELKAQRREDTTNFVLKKRDLFVNLLKT